MISMVITTRPEEMCVGGGGGVGQGLRQPVGFFQLAAGLVHVQLRAGGGAGGFRAEEQPFTGAQGTPVVGA